MNPIFAVIGILCIAIFSTVLGQLIPFYRKELQIEGNARLTSLDGLRGILCFAVLYHHAAVTYYFNLTQKWEAPPGHFFALVGPVSVEFFFCVTGFLFWSRILATKGKMEVWSFLRARWFRIVPLYLFSLLLALAVAARHIDWRAVAVYRDFLKTALIMGVYPPSMLGTFDFSLVLARTPWSLQYEWGFYFALAALAPIARDGQDRRIFLLFVAIYVIYGHGLHDFFAAGIIAAYVARHEKWSRLLRSWVGSLIVLVALPLVFALPHFTGRLATLTSLVPSGMLLTTMAFIPMACGCNVFGVLRLSGLRLMGIISYSVYLLHGIFLFAARSTFARQVPHYRHQSLVFWLIVLLIAFGVHLTGLLTYRWIEHTFIELERRYRSTPDTAPDTAPIVRNLVLSRLKGLLPPKKQEQG